MPESTVEERMAAAERVIERLRKRPRPGFATALDWHECEALLWLFDLEKAGREARRAMRDEEG